MMTHVPNSSLMDSEMNPAFHSGLVIHPGASLWGHNVPIRHVKLGLLRIAG